MDAHVKICEELFSAAKTEFKHMEYFIITIVFMTMYGKTIKEDITNMYQLGMFFTLTLQTIRSFLLGMLK